MADLQPIPGKVGAVPIYALHKSKEQLLLDRHKGIAIGCLHIEGDVDCDLLPSDFVQEDSAVQPLYDALVLPNELPHVGNHIAHLRHVLNPNACK